MAYVAVIPAYLSTGVAIKTSARVFAREFETLLPGKPLPSITESLLSYGHSSSVALNAILGLIFCVSLFLLEFKGSTLKAFQPFFMGIVFIIPLLQMSTALAAFTMPFLLLGSAPAVSN